MLFVPWYDLGHQKYWCVPTAISSVTNEPMSKIHELIKSYTDKPVVRAADVPLMKLVMDALGWSVLHTVQISADFWSTAEAVAKNSGPFIFVVDGHVMALSHGRICDTFTGIPRLFRDAQYMIPEKHTLLEGWIKFERRRKDC